MEITQTARVYVKYGETLAFGLCNDYGEENERIGLFTSYEELATYCRENGIHCVDLEPEEKDILTVYQYELRQKMPEDKRLTYVRVGRRRRKSCVYVSFPWFRAYDGGIGAADPVWHCG